MEGQEVSVMLKSEVVKHTVSFRVDAEFFKKEYLNDDKAIAKNGFDKLGNLTTKINVGFVGSMVENYRENGIALLQTKNIDSFFINNNNLIKVSSDFHKQLKKSQIKFEDILIARSGSFGKASIYLETDIINSSDIILVEANNEKVNPYFLVSYLNSKYGINQMIRFSSGGLQGHVNLTILEELEVPNLDKIFQNCIEDLIRKAYIKKTDSEITYKNGENILLQEIGLNDFELSNEAVNIKNFRESFGITKRLDAEYYQKKYEQILDKIVKQKHDSLSNIVHISKSIEPGSSIYDEDDGLPFYRVSDFSKSGLTTPSKNLSWDFVTENINQLNRLKPKKNSILFSKDGTVGTAYLLIEDLNGITSGAILNLKIKEGLDILPEYLTLALNSKLVQMQAERDAGGSIILHWRLEEIQNVVVPIIDLEIQKQIAKLIRESFALKAESANLLDVAKRAVEIAIEENEQTAIKFIQKNS
ncbi:restriction endonuclease subunit S [Chryseobacterium schmidteae]|uniref:restriction endonuclease subunit S n=1 Tax=Chryseobacterium schmidteae TaxID=2730404 RepID=UPI001E3DACB1|nr:restriction endonuclease subunit S [Chryseobacterium schmidteae]